MWEKNKIPSVIDMSEEEYRSLDYCSYSFLSKISELGYRAFLRGKKSGKALSLGSFVDCYILTPEELEDKFVATIKHPTGNKKILSEFVGENFSMVPDLDNLYDIASELGLWSTRKKETVLKDFDPAFIKYLTAVINSKGKSEYSLEDLELANICKNALYENHLVEHIFHPEEYDLEVSFQTKGIFKMDDTHIKFMVDILVIDSDKKEISIFDLKTGEGDLDSFEKSFLKYRYDIQYYLYTRGIESIKESLGYSDYKVNPLQFIYLSKKDPEFPVIYEVPDIDVYNGYTTKYGYKMIGVKQLLSDFNFYNAGVRIPRRMVEGNGMITLDI